MNYTREAFDLPPFALAVSAVVLLTLGYIGSGPTLGGILVTSAAIVRELAVHWFEHPVSR